MSTPLRFQALLALAAATLTCCSLLLPEDSLGSYERDGGDGVDADSPPDGTGGPDDSGADARRDGVVFEDADPEARCFAEVCNGRDDDCDGEVDEDFECPAGRERPCEGCGEMGSQDCVVGCVWGPCDSACPLGTPDCCGSRCTDVRFDPDNCGRCSSGCPSSCCYGTCVDTSSDGRNCGTCGNECDFALTCCGGNCVSTMTSRAHCGRCFNRCPGLQGCWLGSCGMGG